MSGVEQGGLQGTRPRDAGAARVSPAWIVAGIASAATTGAIIAMGHRDGSIDLPFAAIGALLLREQASARATEMVATGFAVHLSAMFAWSLLGVWLVERQRWRIPVAAVVIGAGQSALAMAVAWASHRGLASVLQLGDRIVFFLVFVIAVGVGMRFAFFSGELQGHDSTQRAHPL